MTTNNPIFIDKATVYVLLKTEISLDLIMQTWDIVIKNVERDTIQAMGIADIPITPPRLHNFINRLKLHEKNLLDLQRYVESQLDEIRNKVGPREIEKIQVEIEELMKEQEQEDLRAYLN